ncbi:MAG: radical SAM protein [Hadesarchaea archaeon]|nr:radical SAM protein [Hadesarchaea archaeon]
MPYDPLDLARRTEKIVVKEDLRKYYRVARGGRWYGGIASADCCGCNLRCAFCWSGAPRDHPERIGRFYSPEEVFERLTFCAEKFGYRKIRVSGNEPTIGREHLLRLLELADETRYTFILESNGALIDRDLAKKLSGFEHLHVRVSLKGTNPEEFSHLTGAIPEGFNLQLRGLGNLVDAGVPCHAAVMVSFSREEDLERLRQDLAEIDPALADVEEEYVILYPHVVERLRRAGLRPRVTCATDRKPTKTR